MKVKVVKSFATLTHTFEVDQVIDLPKGADWLKSKLVKRIRKVKVEVN